MNNNLLLAMTEKQYLAAKARREHIQNESVKYWDNWHTRSSYRCFIKYRLEEEMFYLRSCTKLRLALAKKSATK